VPAISLLNGWAPLALQVITAVVLVLAIGWRTPRWRTRWLPASVVVGLIAVGATYWYIASANLSGGRPAPVDFWIWVGLAGLAIAVAALGWRRNRWWRRGASLLAVPMCALCVALAVNLWTGYLPTVQSAWDQATGRPLPGQTDASGVAAMQRQGAKPVEGTVVSVSIPATESGFAHRDELIYLPPGWYATNPPPRLPVVMMIGGVFGTPADWLRAGEAKETLDEFAAQHGGNAPVVVFVDAGGTFRNDTECVNGVRGNAADHLTKDVVPYVSSHFATSTDPANWGVVGWSMGGTCAVTVTMKYPELFSSFVAIDNEQFPNAGTKEQTIARLFGGDVEAFESFQPATVITNHGPYTGIAGWFAISEDVPTVYRPAAPEPGTSGPRTQAPDPLNHAKSANYLCELASDYGAECSVVPERTEHDWPAAAKVFADSLPWLAGRLRTPGVRQIPLPGAPPVP
jgi:S-formylglutathione hydrolase FrmB